MNECRHVPIAVPELGASSIRFSLWHVAVGDAVVEGDRVAELVIPGAVFDVSAPVSGTLVERTAQPGDTVVVHQVIGTLQEDL